MMLDLNIKAIRNAKSRFPQLPTEQRFFAETQCSSAKFGIEERHTLKHATAKCHVRTDEVDWNLISQALGRSQEGSVDRRHPRPQQMLGDLHTTRDGVGFLAKYRPRHSLNPIRWKSHIIIST